MTTTTMLQELQPSTTPTHFSLDMLKDEARQLMESGAVDCCQPIYVLCQFIPAREWVCVECELERNGFLLRDQIADLNPCQEWTDD